jgi:hypothetical protein
VANSRSLSRTKYTRELCRRRNALLPRIGVLLTAGARGNDVFSPPSWAGTCCISAGPTQSLLHPSCARCIWRSESCPLLGTDALFVAIVRSGSWASRTFSQDAKVGGGVSSCRTIPLKRAASAATNTPSVGWHKKRNKEEESVLASKEVAPSRRGTGPQLRRAGPCSYPPTPSRLIQPRPLLQRALRPISPDVESVSGCD